MKLPSGVRISAFVAVVIQRSSVPSTLTIIRSTSAVPSGSSRSTVIA